LLNTNKILINMKLSLQLSVLFLFSFILLAISGKTQLATFTDGVEYSATGYGELVQPLGEKEGFHYTLTKTKNQRGAETIKYFIKKYDSKLEEVSSIELTDFTLNEKKLGIYDFPKALLNNDKIYFIAAENLAPNIRHHHLKSYILYIDLKSFKINNDIVLIQDSKRFYSEYELLCSPDSTKILVYFSQKTPVALMMSSKLPENGFMAVFDSDLKLIWKDSLDLKFDFFGPKTVLTNKGDVVMCVIESKADEDDKFKKGFTDETKIIHISDNGKQIKEINLSVERYLYSANFCYDASNNNIKICGFYSKKGLSYLNGILYTELNLETDALNFSNENEIKFDFPDYDKTLIVNKKNETDLHIGGLYFIHQNIFTLEDNSVIFIAERTSGSYHSQRPFIKSKSSSPNFAGIVHVPGYIPGGDRKNSANNVNNANDFHTDIIVAKFDIKGKLVWKTIINKYNLLDSGPNSPSTGIIDHFDGENLFLIYNTNADNIGVDNPTKYKIINEKSDIVTQITKIDPDGKMETETLRQSKSKKDRRFLLSNSVKCGDNEFILESIKLDFASVYGYISKIKF